MTKFSIAFDYIAHGSIDVEADSEEIAEAKALEQLNLLRDMGSINDPNYSNELGWSGDEVEIL